MVREPYGLLIVAHGNLRGVIRYFDFKRLLKLKNGKIKTLYNGEKRQETVKDAFSPSAKNAIGKV
jgi:hypothetical protein